MRAFALLLLLLGAIVFGLALYSRSLPRLPLQDQDLKIIAGVLVFAGVVGVWFSRER